MERELEYWPIRVEKPMSEWSEFDYDFFGFMQCATEEGFRPRHDRCLEVVAGDPRIRAVHLINRGMTNGWEALIVENDLRTGLGRSFGLSDSACVLIRPPFRAAGYFALTWLRGLSLPSVLLDFERIDGIRPTLRIRNEVELRTVRLMIGESV